MSKDKLTQKMVDEIRKTISDSFVTWAIEKKLFMEFDLEMQKIDSKFETAFSSFKQNINSITSIVQIPYRMAFERAVKLIYDDIFRQESITLTSENYIKKNLEGKSVPTEEEQREKCREIATKKFNEFTLTEDFRIQVQFLSANFIKSLANEGLFSDEFHKSAKELINQASLLSWCALEILVRDTFISFLNNNPEYVEKLYNESSLRNKFDLKSISTEKLLSKNFDLSSSMGDLLIENFDFSNIEIIRSIYATLFNSKELNNSLGNYKIWQLFQRRNLIVHRGGKVDEKYNLKTEDKLKVGEKLFIKPEELNEYLEDVMKIAIALIKETTAHNSGFAQ